MTIATDVIPALVAVGLSPTQEADRALVRVAVNGSTRTYRITADPDLGWYYLDHVGPYGSIATTGPYLDGDEVAEHLRSLATARPKPTPNPSRFARGLRKLGPAS